MRYRDMKLAGDLCRQYAGLEQLMQTAAVLPDDRLLQARFDLPDGARITIPMSKKTILNDLLAQQASLAEKIQKIGVSFDEPEPEEPAVPVGAPAGPRIFPEEGGRDPQPQG